MIYLLFNVCFASAFTLLIKLVHNRGTEDIVTVGAMNYIVAAVLVLPDFYGNRADHLSLVAMVIGAVMGICYFIAFFFASSAVKRIGASSATVVAGLSLLLPIVCGAYLWNEHPNGYQIVGIALAITALALIGQHGTSSDGSSRWFTSLVLVLLFLLAGVARLAQEAFRHASDASQRPTFLIAAFLFAALPSLIVLIVRRRSVSRMEMLLGFAMGAANILQLHFILKSLQQLPGFIVFPVASAGCLMLTAVVATRMLQEHLNRRAYVGITVASIAMVLLNWL